MNEQLTVSATIQPPGAKSGWLACCLIVLTAMAERAWLHFSTPLVPGINGAYYMVQARALIEQGKLGLPDLPLTFWLDALLARVIQLLSGASQATSIMLAVKLEDSLLPALVAVPVFILVRRWTTRAGLGLWLPLGAALVVACGGPALIMVGDFQKNSLGLLLLAALLCQLHRWFENPRPANGALAVVLMGLVGLTHIGVFGWGLALAGLATAIYLWLGAPALRRKILPWLLAGGVACALAGGLVTWKYDPARIQRLTTAITQPFTFLHHDPGQPGPRPAPNDAGQNPRPSGGGGPLMPGAFNYVTGSLFLLVGGAALRVLWLRRASLSTGDIALVGASALVVMALGGPWVTGDKVMRFGLIAVIPSVIALAFALSQTRAPKIRHGVMALVVLVMVGGGVVHLHGGGRPTLTQASTAELTALSAEITNPKKTLIVARHGLEWWVAWYLHTHIVHVDSLQAADWTNFDQVFFLRQKRGWQMPFGLPPNQSGSGGWPWSSSAGHRPRADGPPGGPGGPMAEAEIPPGAAVQHDGENFILALVTTPVLRPARH